MARNPPAQALVVGKGDLTWDPSASANEEIEGLTIWDLDDGRAPSIEGQVHVILLDNDTLFNDDFYFKHMRATTLSKL